MNLAFLLPAALAALATALLPLLIHLARKSEQRPTPFAALRWLRQKPKPRHRIRFDEWLLLVLRVLLVCLFALLLARPVLFGAQSHDPVTVYAPGVDAPKDARRLNAPIATHLRELDASLPSDVVLRVVVPQTLEGMDAQIPKLSRKVEWSVVPGAMPAAPTPPDVTPTLEIRGDSPYLKAANLAWSQSPSPPGRGVGEGVRFVAVVTPGAVPVDTLALARAGNTLLLSFDATIADAPRMSPLWRNAAGEPLIEGAAYGRGRVLRFTRPLVPAQMPELLDGTFPQHLRAALAPPTQAPARVLASTHVPTTGASAYPPMPRDLTSWLLWLIAALFAIERWFATSARRNVAA